MGLVDDLNRLSEMHAAGQLSDEEFDDAKTRLIRESAGAYTPPAGAGAAGATAGGPATSSPYDPTLTPPTLTDPTLTEPTAPGFADRAGGASRPSGESAAAPPPPGSTAVHGSTAGPSPLITSGVGTVAPGSLPPSGRLRTRAMGLTAPAAVEPKRSATGTFVASVGCLTVVILFVALMVATAGVAMFPGLARLSAPFLCKAPYHHSYVDITQSNPVPGETYIQWELQCYNDRGTVQAADEWKVMGIVFLETVAALYLLMFVVILVLRLRRRRRAGPGGAGDGDVHPDPPAGPLGDLSNTSGPIINPPT